MATMSCITDVALSAVYVISPIELIRDIMPVAGWLDDLDMVMLSIASVPVAVAGWIGRTCYVVMKVFGNKKAE